MRCDEGIAPYKFVGAIHELPVEALLRNHSVDKGENIGIDCFFINFV